VYVVTLDGPPAAMHPGTRPVDGRRFDRTRPAVTSYVDRLTAAQDDVLHAVGDPAVLYWDGLGGTGLRANEIGPLLAADHGLHVIAPDPPGHGLSPACDADAFRPSRLAATAA